MSDTLYPSPAPVDAPDAVVAAWLAAANAGDADRLVALSTPDVALVGPRGTARGAGVLRDWLARAGARLETRALFAREARVVAAQHAVWRTPDTGEILGEADVASRFAVAGGRVAEVERFDGPDALDDALVRAQLTVADGVGPGPGDSAGDSVGNDTGAVAVTEG